MTVIRIVIASGTLKINFQTNGEMTSTAIRHCELAKQSITSKYQRVAELVIGRRNNEAIQKKTKTIHD